MAYESSEKDLPAVTDWLNDSDWLNDWDWLDDQWGRNVPVLLNR
ncbi:MAG: hypothetical protein ACFCVK_11465 [Acidimicrobiales bacterium]